MAQQVMRHETIRWNPATEEWFCPKCGRTSGRVREQDAHSELDQYQCDFPWVEMPKAFSDPIGE